VAIWGVADPVPAGLVYTTPSQNNVSCPAGVETTFITTGALSLPSPGGYFPLILLSVAITFGASLPAPMTFAFKLGAGADVDSQLLGTILFTANATILFAIALVGVNSTTSWYPGPSTINITCNPTGQAVTVAGGSTRALVFFQRGPDV
jgi:spore coat protein U-like protein